MGSVVVAVGIVLGAVLSVAFLGGLASAWLELRKERRETGTVTRPGWDRMRERREAGGYLATLRGTVAGLRSERQAAAAWRCSVCRADLVETASGIECVAFINLDRRALRLHRAAAVDTEAVA